MFTDFVKRGAKSSDTTNARTSERLGGCLPSAACLQCADAKERTSCFFAPMVKLSATTTLVQLPNVC